MKQLKYIVYVFFLFYAISGKGQEKVVYNEIQEIKKSGEKFMEIPKVFKETNGSSDDLKYFESGKKPMYYYVKTGKILDSNEKHISFKIPFGSEELVVELKDISDTLENVLVTTTDDTVLKEDTIQKHFRGIIKDDKNSLIALSFFEDYITGFISNATGNYSLLKLKGTNKHVMYNDNWLKEKNQLECTTEYDDFEGYTKEELTNKLGTRDLEECVELFFETEFDMYEALGTVAAVRDFVVSLYIQVSTLYWNSGIKTAISEIKVWTLEDPYTSTTTADLLPEFRIENSGINGDLGQLLTFRSVGGGRAYVNTLCSATYNVSVSQLNNRAHALFPNYSWNVMVISHEFGHSFGSRHTHDCVWNGNNTQIDDCGNLGGSALCFDSSNPIIPATGGTIMSYCHGQSVGINFSLGFHGQVGNLMRNRVDNAQCLSSCEECFETINITTDVNVFGVDHREATYNITASNRIHAFAEAIYHADKSVILDSGFTVFERSLFVAYTEGCTGVFEKRFDDIEINEEITSERVVEKSTNLIDIQLFPNPSKGIINIKTSDHIEGEITIVVVNIYGKIVKNVLAKIDGGTTGLDLSALHKGVYFVKLRVNEGLEFNKKIILK